MSALITYMSQVGNTVSSVKVVFGESGRAVLLSFPSHCRDATEGWRGELNSELKCRRQGKEADVAAQLICNSQTYPGW